MVFYSGVDLPKQYNKWKKVNYTNQTKGDSRTIIGNNLYIKGDMNKVIGDNNLVVGDMNDIIGHDNKVKGDMNKIYGSGDSRGDMNKVRLLQNTRLKEYNKFKKILN